MFKNPFAKGEKQQEISLEMYDPRLPLFQLSDHTNDEFLIKDSFEGISIFGATGSGKTSGSGQAIARSFLANGYGGLVLCAKNDERELWENYAREAGREEDLIVFSPENKWRFNFLNYEYQKAKQAGKASTFNIVNLFIKVLEISERNQSKGKGGDEYWMRAVRQLLTNAVELLSIAYDHVSLPELQELILSAPESKEEAIQGSDWWQSSFCGQSFLAAIDKLNAGKLSKMQTKDIDLAFKYFTNEYASLAEKTRSVIISMFSGMADNFVRGQMGELFCTETNFIPDSTGLEGKIIILDLPVQDYYELGQFAQVLFKLIWQRSVESRFIPNDEEAIPLFLWIDEAQYFLSSSDQMFQTTARSKRISTVMLTQNISNYYEVLGGESTAKSNVDSLLGNLQTKIFHANGDAVTNTWAAEAISKTIQFRTSVSNSKSDSKNSGSGYSSSSGPGTNSHNSGLSSSSSKTFGGQQQVDYQVMPYEFTILRKGGHENNLQVDCFFMQAGRIWQKNKCNHIQRTWQQG